MVVSIIVTAVLHRRYVLKGKLIEYQKRL